MEFKIDLKDTYHAVSVTVDVRAESDQERVQEYLKKIEEVTNNFFFDYPEKFIPVYLEDSGPNKLHCIKTVRECINMGLKEAKDLVEAPKPVCLSEGMPRALAIELKNKLQACGASAVAGPARFHVMK